MKLNRRTLAVTAVALAALSLGAAQAQSFPAKPVTVIVPFAPGGGIDVLTRAIGVKLAARWGQPIVVENRPGAGSMIGSSVVARAPADGYTLLATVNQTMVGNRFIYKKMPYDVDKSFEPISMMVKADQFIIANVNLPANSLKDVIALARAKPDSLNYGSFGNGSQPHLLFSLIKDRENVKMTHVPYNGITPNLTALASGEVQLGSASAAVVAPLLQSGKIKLLAVAGDSRISQHPNVSTTTEQGFAYAKVAIWYGLFAPAGTPTEVVNEIRNAVQAILKDPQFAEQQITSKGLAVIASDGRYLRDVIRKEADVTESMVKAAGIVAE
ncbi:MAG: tripartite tricarboxylate transporter substrate-binding protein [Burkholderiaceae bacterium]|nr:tripartite tricarboxylate transporter substrate-binding protein [Burkholderiaceae bacterium]